MVRATSGCGTRVSSSRQRARCRQEPAERAPRLRLQLVAFDQPGGRRQQRDAAVAGEQVMLRRLAVPRPRFGTLTMRSKARSSSGCTIRRK